MKMIIYLFELFIRVILHDRKYPSLINESILSLHYTPGNVCISLANLRLEAVVSGKVPLLESSNGPVRFLSFLNFSTPQQRKLVVELYSIIVYLLYSDLAIVTLLIIKLVLFAELVEGLVEVTRAHGVSHLGLSDCLDGPRCQLSIDLVQAL
jgi:hypothetical protein